MDYLLHSCIHFPLGLIVTHWVPLQLQKHLLSSWNLIAPLVSVEQASPGWSPIWMRPFTSIPFTFGSAVPIPIPFAALMRKVLSLAGVKKVSPHINLQFGLLSLHKKTPFLAVESALIFFQIATELFPLMVMSSPPRMVELFPSISFLSPAAITELDQFFMILYCPPRIIPFWDQSNNWFSTPPAIIHPSEDHETTL